MTYKQVYDPTGKEMYVGDILGNSSVKGVVKFFDCLTYDSGGAEHSGFYCEEFFDYEDLSYHYSLPQYKIIGNIYENPELV